MLRIAITGASAEIGQAIASRLALPGDHVLLHAFNSASACEQLSLPPTTTRELVVADFRHPEALRGWCAAIRDVDVLINAAAVTRTQLLPALDDDDIAAMLDVNVKALIATCRSVLPGMMARRRGVIVNISSVAAQRANRGQSVYAGTKGFVEAFTRGLAAEYGARGIRANCVAPGAIEAGSLRPLLEQASDTVRQSTAARRLGTTDDVAAAVAFLCSPDASFINGNVLSVDGGFMQGV